MTRPGFKPVIIDPKFIIVLTVRPPRHMGMDISWNHTFSKYDFLVSLPSNMFTINTVKPCLNLIYMLFRSPTLIFLRGAGWLFTGYQKWHLKKSKYKTFLQQLCYWDNIFFNYFGNKIFMTFGCKIFALQICF